MDIGVPKEIKNREFRVGLSPQSVRVLCDRGHRVFVETQAGVGSGFADDDYRQVGATVVESAGLAWEQPLVVKVKEPLPEEYAYLKGGGGDRLLFTYLHLAAERELTEALMESGILAIAYETVQLPDGRLPLLAPMSVIAGRLSVQFGAHFLERPQGGRGVLLGGVPGVPPGDVVILGGGVVGTEAARVAIGLGARVRIFDINLDRLSYLEMLFGSRVELQYSSPLTIEAAVPDADLLVGAALVLGRKPPTLVSQDLVHRMKPGAVIVDVAVDQGGCIETIRPTSHTEPTYLVADVLHYGVPNMPGSVPRTATQSLNHSTLPYVLKLAEAGTKAIEMDEAIASGVNVRDHQLVHPAVREVFGDL
ncbi:alanine dehydrogenase [Sodalinema gerasimenkoae]|uniref:alanine dehydrogenase n=1 Tax=Sodalinema gerasimenkoae TaxID=2862348 RepID=UPI00135985E4|nr:alanine dehydrogenase [Sodalinema gerasimenkoae]